MSIDIETNRLLENLIFFDNVTTLTLKFQSRVMTLNGVNDTAQEVWEQMRRHGSNNSITMKNIKC